MLDRRGFLVSGSAAALAAQADRPVSAQTPTLRGALDGALDARALGVRTDASDEQTAALQRAIESAAAAGRPLFLPGGRYVVDGLRLPSGAHVVGHPGATRLVARGGGSLVTAERSERVSLAHIVLDGADRPLAEPARGLLHALGCRELTLDGVTVVDARRSGIVLESCGGRVERCTVTRVGDAGIFARDSVGLAIEGNTISEIGNNAIQVWRSAPGEDGTIVTGNRITSVRFDGGGNGQNGNGVNLYRAGGVLVSGNTIADCAFSAIRNNAGANCRIVANAARRSGEVAIFVEFGFEGAVVSGNLVEGAAAGISITNFDHGGRLAAVHGNVVRDIAPRSATNPDTTPYGIAAEADTAISGNVVENSPGEGLRLGWGPYLRDVAATGNVVRGAAIGIAVSVAPGAGRATVADNIVSDARRGAVLGMAWRRVATRDLARERDGTHGNVTVARNVVG